VSLQLLNAKERKRLLAQLEAQFGCDASVLKGYRFRENARGRIFVANEELFERFDLEVMKTDSVGLYVCTRLSNGALRMSVEGSQLIGPSSTKNVLTLDDAEFAKWIRGNDVAKVTDLKGFVLVRHGEDFCGCGKPVLDEKSGTVTVHNYVPKTRYVRSND